MSSEKSKIQKIHDAHALVWRNLPAFPSTFSQCECGRGHGRGGGPCIQCAEETLAGLVGQFEAWQYIEACHRVRALEREHISKSKPDSLK